MTRWPSRSVLGALSPLLSPAGVLCGRVAAWPGPDIFSRSGIARYTSALAQSLGSMLGPENVDVLCFFSWGPPNNDTRGFRLMGMVSGQRRAGSFSRLLFLLKA